MPKYRPLEGFPTTLIPLLLKAAVEPLSFSAEDTGASPIVHTLPISTSPEEADRTIRTRWNALLFSTPEAARRFKGFQHLAHELHELRRSMKHFNHPNAADVYRVKISLDDYTGTIRIRSHDAALAELLRSANDNTGPTAPSSTEPASPLPDFDDPLNPKETTND